MSMLNNYAISAGYFSQDVSKSMFFVRIIFYVSRYPAESIAVLGMKMRAELIMLLLYTVFCILN